MPIRFVNRKNEIRDELIRIAKAGYPFATYEEFGERVGIWRMRGAGDLLDLISREETDAKRPDITFVLRSATTRYPSQICFRPAKPPDQRQKEAARKKMQHVIDCYCPGERNPY